MLTFIQEGPIPANRLPVSYWCTHGNFSVYCRRSVRFVDGAKRATFIIANIECPTSERGKGQFTELLNTIETEAKRCGFVILSFESVLNNRFANFLTKRGYVKSRNVALLDFDKILVESLVAI